MKRISPTGFILSAILLVGTCIRIHGIDFGLPFLYNFDEPIFVQAASKMLGNQDLNPHWFGHPGTPVMYLLSLLYVIVYFVGHVLGVFHGINDYKLLYFQDPTIFYLSGRVLFALFGVASILILYRIAKRMFDRTTGLIASGILALSPLHVYYSKIIRTDILMTFLILVAFWYCLDILKKGTWSNYILAGLFTGLAVSTKYPAAVFALIIVSAYLLNRNWSDFPKVIVSGITCLLGIFLGSPFLFLETPIFFSDLISENSLVHLSATGEGFFRNIAWYVRDPLWRGISPTGFLLLFIGAPLCLLSKNKGEKLLVIFPVIFILLISSLHLRWARWIIPVIPFMCLLATRGIVWLVNTAKQRTQIRVHQWWLGAGLLLAVAIPLLKADLIRGLEMSGKDTCTIAREWIMDHIPKGSRILLETYTPQLPSNWYTYLYVDHDGNLVEVDPKQIRHSVYRPPYAQIGMLKNIEAIREQKVEYMVLSHFYDRHLSEKNLQPDYPIKLLTYEKLMHQGEKMYEVFGVSGKFSGPPIRVYRFE